MSTVGHQDPCSLFSQNSVPSDDSGIEVKKIDKLTIYFYRIYFGGKANFIFQIDVKIKKSLHFTVVKKKTHFCLRIKIFLFSLKSQNQLGGNRISLETIALLTPGNKNLIKILEAS